MLGLIECLPATNPAAQRCAKAYEECVARQEQFARSGARLAIPVPPDLDCPPLGSGNRRPQDGSALLPIDDSESRSPSVNSPASYRPAVRRPVATKHRKLQPPDPSGCRRKPFHSRAPRRCALLVIHFIAGIKAGQCNYVLALPRCHCSHGSCFLHQFPSALQILFGRLAVRRPVESHCLSPIGHRTGRVLRRHFLKLLIGFLVPVGVQ